MDIRDLLLGGGKISLQQHSAWSRLPFEGNEAWIKEAVDQGLVQRDDIEEVKAIWAGIPPIGELLHFDERFPPPLSSNSFNIKVPYSLVKRCLILPFEEKELSVNCVTYWCPSFHTIDELSLLLGKEISLYFCRRPLWDRWVAQLYHHRESTSLQKLPRTPSHTEQIQHSSSPRDILDVGGSAVAEALNVAVSIALQKGATDIHLEPREKGEAAMTYRVNGNLHAVPFPPVSYESFVLHVKVLASLDVAQCRLPQDGRMRLDVGKRIVDIRISTVPLVTGERLVMRLLDRNLPLRNFKSLGMSPQLEKRYVAHLHNNGGLLLIAGPTGSGKTTTLYSTLHLMKKEGKNIITIEDPVEYQLCGISQMSVHHEIDFTFSRAIRHMLRQDPDWIVVGEIRDSETAKNAVRASLTGHLVLSTIHAQDAFGVIMRLLDMGVPNYLISESLSGILSQRLVKSICPSCREVRHPPLSELKKFKKLNMGKHHSLYAGRGCKDCLGTGYSGRRALFSFLPVNQEVRSLLSHLEEGNRTLFELIRESSSLRREAKNALLQGETSLQEIMRFL